LAADIAAHEGEMRFRTEIAAVENGPKISERGGQHAFGASVHAVFVTQPEANQLGNRDHLQAMLRAEFMKLRDARHSAVPIHDFADHAGWIEPREAREVDGGFRLASANEYAALFRAQREDVARPREITRSSSRVDGGEDGLGAVGG